MTDKEWDILIGTFSDSLSRTVGLKNLLGNEIFIKWFLPKLRLIKEIQYWSRDKMTELVDVRLRKCLAHINGRSLFWRGFFEEHDVDLKSSNIFIELMKLPVTNKTNLVRWEDKIFVTDDDTSTVDYYSSGTTGVPIKVRVNESHSIKNELVYTFEPDVFEVENVEALLYRKFVLLLGRRATGIWSPYSESFALDTAGTLQNRQIRQQIYDKIQHNSLIYLFAYSSVILELMKYVDEDHILLPIIAHLSGEGLLPAEERFIHETTGMPVTFQYNCKEAGNVGAKCPVNIGKNLYHIYRERVIVEIVDEDGKQLKSDEEGDIVLTVLDRTTTPIIRYATGDRGKILSKLCSCGRLSPLLELKGRGKDAIMLPNGGIFSVLLFRTLLVKEIGLRNIGQYQIIQTRNGCLKISLVPRRNFDLGEIKFIETKMANVLDNQLKINIYPVNHIESYDSGKSKVFISLKEKNVRYERIDCI